MKLKKGMEVTMPYVYPGPDVAKIIIETVNDVTGVVEEVKLIKNDGKIEYMEVSNIVIKAITIVDRIVRFFVNLFRKKK